MDERKDISKRMREMAVNTGALNCLGCGHESNCGIHGCAVLKRAADLLNPAADTNRLIPLTQANVEKMHFDKIWLSYGPEEGDGEWAVVIFGRIYSIDALEGAGLEDMLADLLQGETLDHPTGRYVAYPHRPNDSWKGR